MLYEKYRPKTFSDMVGQEYTSSILQNQILAGNIAHSYLLCGTRGTGKTTSARIFARAINCTSPINGEPCGKCINCTQNSIDIIELDAASHNGVDDIREIISQMNYAPSQGKYKIFIIDEAHMLSKSATNAFLKALEEPPKHVIFILATTDPQQLPITIISRCQRFDFRRIPVNKIISRLQYICEKEQINIEPNILELIAKASDGAMRDALSILEKIISMKEEERNEKTIAQLLSMNGFGTISKVISSIIDNNIFNVLSIINELDNEGQDFEIFIKDTIKYVRNLMILSANGPEEIIAATKEDIVIMKQIVSTTTSEKIIGLLELLQAAENNIKWNGNAKVALETVAIKLNQDSKSENEELKELKNLILHLQNSLNTIQTAPVTQPIQNQYMKNNIQNTAKYQQPNPVVLAKQQIIEVANQYEKHKFANALEKSKIFMQNNILIFQSDGRENKKILEANVTNLTAGFSKYLQKNLIININ